MSKVTGYLPSVRQIAQETGAVLAAAVIAAFVLSQFPALKAFVKENSFS